MKYEALFKAIELAENMAGYIHHIGYPNYDGGHTEPESECDHEDCKAVRIVKETKWLSE